MNTTFRIAPGAFYSGRAPQQDRTYLAFVRSHPCAVCGDWRNVESCHTGPRGLSTRSDDRSAINLCRKHHRLNNDSLHALGPVKFEERHNVVIAELREQLNEEYDALKRARKFPGRQE